MPADTYQNYLVPIDCSEDSQRNAIQIARHLGNTPCKVTLAAVMTPAAEDGERRKRMLHAWEALRRVADVLRDYGIYTHSRIVEGGDHAAALASEASAPERCYDGILLGAYQARPEDLETPCQASLVDRLCLRARVPVIVLPFSRLSA